MKEPAFNKDNLDLVDDRSDVVKEILGKAPNKFIRSGTTAIALIVIMLLAGTVLINYNDIIATQIVVTSKNPPVYLKAKTFGKLTEIFVSQDQKVRTDQILAEIENTATLKDIVYLKGRLQDFEPHLDHIDSLRTMFPAYLDLGSIQKAYGEFITQYQNLILYNALSPDKKEAFTIRRQLEEQHSLLEKQNEQLYYFQQDLALSRNTFERNKQLYQKGVISKAEYEEANRKYISDQQRNEAFKASISNTQISIADFNNLLMKSGVRGEEFENSHRQQLEKAYQNLINEILQWEQLYTLRSPINGKVTVFDIWNKNQNVAVGETIFTVVPNNLGAIIGRIKLPLRNSGKVAKGQKVIVKLANYPFREWGSLEGEIINISQVPKQGEETFYMAYVSINSMETSFNKTIKFQQEMQGTAEIVIEELSVLQRIFYSFRDFFSRA